jgi:alkylated DNA nucleotide flippase Atl1
VYKSIRYLTFGGFTVVGTILAVAMTALAKSGDVETYKNVATGFCLDSNSARQVYTQPCNNGSYQKWRVTVVTPNRILKNLATGFCLDSNSARQVYTRPCNNSSYQKWRVIQSSGSIELKNLATGFCLDSNSTRQVYTQPCNNGSYQKWK